MNLTDLAENGVAAVAHAILDDLLFALFGRSLLISAGANQPGERSDAGAQQRVAADRAEHGAAGAAGGGADAGIFGFLGVVARGARRLLAFAKVTIVLRLAMAAHVDHGPIARDPTEAPSLRQPA